jgi:Leucine-rich repeat (LRR) protein
LILKGEHTMSPTYPSRHYLIPLTGLTLLLSGLAQAETDCTAVTEIPQAECEALIDLYKSTDGANWTDNLGWNVTNNPCEWGGVFYQIKEVTYEKGVVCENGHVRKIDLYTNNLNGFIPESITTLTRLNSLKLGNNNLSGTGSQPIPEFIGELTHLRTLSLSGNQFIGSIPESLKNLIKLRSLSLSNNLLVGDIPTFFGDLINLKTLSLSRNKLTGSIQVLENLTNLQSLWLYSNKLDGTIDVLVNFTQLIETSLSYNRFSGTLPDGLGNLTNLVYLSLHHNKLSGLISESLANLNRLETLALSHNKLRGSIPNVLGNLSNLNRLSLHYNQLSGSLPESLGNLSNLQELWLYKNQLSGSIPDSFGNLSQLQKFSLSNNQLSGSIPDSLANLNQLEQLSLHKNQLSGTFPEFLANFSSLQRLKLNDNELCGKVPASLMNLTQLSLLAIDNNHLTTSDAVLMDWLNHKNPTWAMTQTPCFASGQSQTCLVYAVHDEGLNNSQLLTINPDNGFEVNALGEVHAGYDIEGMDIHPQTEELYVSSGDDPADGLAHGYLYKANKNTGTLTEVCSTGLGEVSAMSFHPQTYQLWVWADGEGLFTIDINQINNGVCEKTEIFSYPAKVEGIAWGNEGKRLYGVSNTVLYEYEDGAVEQVCDDFSSEVEALSMLADGTLLFALHDASDTRIHSFDIENCLAKQNAPVQVETLYTDIEGITSNCPIR